jgi:Planctomycete cytochrome C
MKYRPALLTLALATAQMSVLGADPDLSKLPPASKQEGVTYAKDIHPLFEASCLRCHGGQKPRGGLRLDTLEGALKGGKDGKVIEPGNSEKSDLVIAVAQIDPHSAMPPKPRAPRPPMGDAGTNQPPRPPQGPPPKPLTAEEVGLVRAWIDQGAK